MPVGIHEPPAAVDFFDAEEAGRFDPAAAVPSVGAVIEIARAQPGLFGRPGFAERFEARRLARPVGRNPLAEFVHHRPRLQDRVARVLPGEPDRADLQRRSPDRVLHGHADGFHGVQRPHRTRQIDPERPPRLVAQGSQVEALAVRAEKVAQGHGGANPDAGEGMQPLAAPALRGVQAQLEALGR